MEDRIWQDKLCLVQLNKYCDILEVVQRVKHVTWMRETLNYCGILVGKRNNWNEVILQSLANCGGYVKKNMAGDIRRVKHVIWMRETWNYYGIWVEKRNNWNEGVILQCGRRKRGWRDKGLRGGTVDAVAKPWTDYSFTKMNTQWCFKNKFDIKYKNINWNVNLEARELIRMSLEQRPEQMSWYGSRGSLCGTYIERNTAVNKTGSLTYSLTEPFLRSRQFCS
jgi:hypothetical protein